MNKFIARYNKNKEYISVYDHSLNVADLTKEFSRKFGNEDLGYILGLMHDLGKYSQEFQKKITGINRNQEAFHNISGAQ